jgi:hypothetical protein
MPFPKTVLICTCTHHKREHLHTVENANAPCTSCDCAAFTPEPLCRCGHGKKAHAKGPCHESYRDDCLGFEPVNAAK